ncbi:ATP-dependent Clp protease ATP-binding subunit [Patescibacteria group bacterium]|nr:ATP-dependent Clp protease ATP-binding subunit [Patescibacteria group bacterium]
MPNKINFNLKETAIFQALQWDRLLFLRFANFFKNTFLVLLIFSLFFVGLSFLGVLYIITALRISFFFLMLFVVFWEVSLFFNTKIKNPKLSASPDEVIADFQKYNLAEFLNFESAKIVSNAVKFCKRRKVSEVSAMALLTSALKESEQIKYIFLRLGLNVDNVRQNLKNHLEKLEKNNLSGHEFSEDFELALIEAIKMAQKSNRQRVEARDILVGVSKAEFFKDILIEANLKIEDFENITLWFDYLQKKIEEKKEFWSYENLAAYGSLGKDWATGYTVTLDQYSIDWRRMVRQWLFKAIIGHEKEIEQIQAALSKPDANNVLLIGEPGTGRESIIEGLARRIYLGKGLPEINHYRVVELDMVSFLSRTTNPEEVESILDRIFQEVVAAGNIILVIKEFHNYIGLEVQQPGAIDISGIIGKYLNFPQFKLIGVTTYSGLHTRIEKTSISEMFTKIEVSEVSEAETIRILQNLAIELERKYKIFITYPAIRELVSLANRYIPNAPFPKKAIDLLRDTAVYIARSVKEKIVLPEHVAKIVSTKTEIPVGKVEFQEKETLLNLEKLIHQRIVNQEEAVKEISVAMRRARAGIASKKRPMGNFLFLGPTGVGKTETSKALADIYFGGEQKMIRLDMSEFQAISDIPRLIGKTGEEGLLTTPIRENPFSLLLMDEIEKAHPNILNLFLQVFDEGHITDGQGRKVMFTNVIIICTSNAGANMIWAAVKKNKPIDKENLLGKLFGKGIFKPEFINRFDAAVIFKPLSRENLLDISQLMLNSLKKNLKEKDIELIITDSLKEKIVELSYKPAFGAREMRRVIQDNVENSIAQALLSDQIKKGDSFEISADDFSIKTSEDK